IPGSKGIPAGMLRVSGMRTEVPWIAPGGRPASADASNEIGCLPCGPVTTTVSPSAVNSWQVSLCCLLVSSQSMSRNSTKAKGGVGVWHCRHPSPRAWTFRDWTSACAASARNRPICMRRPEPRSIVLSPRDLALSLLPPHEIHENLPSVLSAGSYAAAGSATPALHADGHDAGLGVNAVHAAALARVSR